MGIDRVAVIDYDSVAYKIFHPNKIFKNGIPQRTEDGKKFLYIEKSENEVIQSMNDVMNDILTKGEFTGFCGFIKGKNTIQDKLRINPLYKQDRSQVPPKHWSFTKSKLIEIWGAIESNFIETDDSCNIARLNIPNSHLCVIDSDLLGLEGVHYNWSKNEWVNTTKEQEMYKLYCDTICGGHNNTKGIPKKGIKFCEKLFSGCYTETHYKTRTYKEFVKYYKEDARSEFLKNYLCCKTLKEYSSFVIPTVTEYKIGNEEDENKIDDVWK